MKIVIKAIEEADLPAIKEVFARSVLLATAKEYSETERKAWLGDRDLSWWAESFLAKKTAAAWVDGRLVGFGDAKGSYIDRLYVDPDCLRHGVGKAVLEFLEAGEPFPLEVYASKTARPFFEHQGYEVVRENVVERAGVNLLNYFMRKYRK